MLTRRFARGIALATALSLSLLTAGCYGKFQLTRMIYDLNRSVEDKYVRSAVTWALLLPYAFSTVIDFTVFNIVEFWTGENPLLVTKAVKDGADTVTLTMAREGAGTVATLDRFRGGRRVATLVIRDGGDGVVRSSLVENGVETRSAVARQNADGTVSVEGRVAGAAFAERHGASALSALRVRVESALARDGRG